MHSITAYSETLLPTQIGAFRTLVYHSDNGEEAVALVSGDVRNCHDVPVRVHSACFTAEVLGSLKCDCREQLEFAMRYIGSHGGVVVYLNQEGRGIGLGNKIRAYALQEKGVDTVDANLALGLPQDSRTYEFASAILEDLGVKSIRLMTNNPHKTESLTELGVDVRGRLPVEIPGNPHSQFYLHVKQQRMGHMLTDAENETSTEVRDRPFVHVNFALDGEGKFESSQISCDRDWQRVHELRERYVGIGVGANTWNKDKPRLTVRKERLGRMPHNQPIPIIFAGNHKCEVSEDSRQMFHVGAMSPIGENTTHIHTSNRSLKEPLKRLFTEGIDSMLVEGGPTLLKSFLNQGMVDKVTVYVRTNTEDRALAAARCLINELVGDLTVTSFGEGVLITKVFEPLSLRAAQ